VPINILIVDDHAMVRKVLQRHLGAQQDFTIAGEAANGREGLAKVQALLPDVVLMDVAMPGMDGIEATRLISEQFPQVRVLILSLYNSTDNYQRAMNAGARGYILKESAADEVVTAIRTIVKGGSYRGADVVHPPKKSDTES